MKEIDERDEDFSNCIKAKENIDALVNIVNEEQRKFEQEQKKLILQINKIQDSIEDGEILELSVRNRTIKKIGDINIGPKGGRQLKKIWLFDTMMVIAIPHTKPKRDKRKTYLSKLDTFHDIKNITVIDSEGNS